MCTDGSVAPVPTIAASRDLGPLGEPIALEPVDSVSVLTVCDNTIDPFLLDEGPARRMPISGRAAQGPAAGSLVEFDWTWAFVLDDLGDGRTRFLFRSRFRVGPWWMAAGYHLGIVSADVVMSRQMLPGVRDRAERTTQTDLAAAAA